MKVQDRERQTAFLRYSHTVGLSVMEGRGYYYPVDSVIDPDGNLCVLSRGLDADPRSIRVTVSDPDSEYLGSFVRSGEHEGGLVWPAGMAMDSRGRFFISDDHTHLISIFDSSRQFQSRWGTHGSEPGELNGPSGLAFDGDDNLYVVDHLNHRVQKFTPEGAFLLAFGSEGSGDGQLNLPWGVTVAPNGDVYVADWRNDRVQRFSPDGRFVAAYGTSGRGDGELRRPAGVAVDGDGYIYVADWGNERVQVLDPDGGFVVGLRGESGLSKWAQEFMAANAEEAEARSRSDLEKEIELRVDDPHEKSSHIEKLFWGPASVKLDSAGRLYVTEMNRHRVQVYERGV